MAIPATGRPSLERVTIPEIVPAFENVNGMPLLAWPPTVTITGPVVALLGTGTVMLAVDQALGLAAVPLKVIVLVPRVDPNAVPTRVM
jgi:hypothetical protein